MVSHVKGVTGRDFAAEYIARKARAALRGLTTAQARGHAPAGKSITTLRKSGAITTTGSHKADSVLLRFYRAVEGLAQGKSLRQASKSAGISPSTVKRLNKERELYQPEYHYKNGKPTTVKGYRVEQSGSTPILTSTGELIVGPQVDAKNATILGRYWNAVDKALRGDTRDLQPFAHTVVYETTGQEYHLLTNINAIRLVLESLSEEDAADFQRNFYSGRRIVYAA